MFSNEVAHKLVAAASAKLFGSLRMALSGPNILKVHLTRALEELMAVRSKNNSAQLLKNHKANGIRGFTGYLFMPDFTRKHSA